MQITLVKSKTFRYKVGNNMYGHLKQSDTIKLTDSTGSKLDPATLFGRVSESESSGVVVTRQESESESESAKLRRLRLRTAYQIE